MAAYQPQHQRRDHRDPGQDLGQLVPVVVGVADEEQGQGAHEAEGAGLAGPLDVHPAAPGQRHDHEARPRPAPRGSGRRRPPRSGWRPTTTMAIAATPSSSRSASGVEHLADRRDLIEVAGDVAVDAVGHPEPAEQEGGRRTSPTGSAGPAATRTAGCRAGESGSTPLGTVRMRSSPRRRVRRMIGSLGVCAGRTPGSAARRGRTGQLAEIARTARPGRRSRSPGRAGWSRPWVTVQTNCSPARTGSEAGSGRPGGRGAFLGLDALSEVLGDSGPARVVGPRWSRSPAPNASPMASSTAMAISPGSSSPAGGVPASDPAARWAGRSPASVIVRRVSAGRRSPGPGRARTGRSLGPPQVAAARPAHLAEWRPEVAPMLS